VNAVRSFLRNNGLTLFFLLILGLALAGQAISGVFVFNDRQLTSGGAQVSLAHYLTSSQFAVDVAENWQSEFLQFFLYIFVTVWLVQRGSPESKKPAEAGLESDERQKVGEHAEEDSPPWAAARGWRLGLFSRSLGLLMGALFLLSWLAQSIAGLSAYNADQLADYQDPVAWTGYVTSADFWNRSLQNWQSEFLAVAAMAVFSIYLRQRGSPESKPVGEPHAATGIEG
jgi:membrane protein implicated in regulation of membrane protease activity